MRFVIQKILRQRKQNERKINSKFRGVFRTQCKMKLIKHSTNQVLTEGKILLLDCIKIKSPISYKTVVFVKLLNTQIGMN